jgi:hypothetical protein
LGRALAIVAFVLFAVQAGGLALAVETACFERCEDDGPDGNCAPTCADCRCCAQPRVPPTPTSDDLIPPAPVARRSWSPQAAPVSPDPSEILRVPKRG